MLMSSTYKTRFTTGDEEADPSKKHIGDDYFLTSGDKIRFFFEEDAIGADGKLNRPKELAINKFGHGVFSLDRHMLNVTEVMAQLCTNWIPNFVK